MKYIKQYEISFIVERRCFSLIEHHDPLVRQDYASLDKEFLKWLSLLNLKLSFIYKKWELIITSISKRKCLNHTLVIKYKIHDTTINREI